MDEERVNLRACVSDQSARVRYHNVRLAEGYALLEEGRSRLGVVMSEQICYKKGNAHSENPCFFLNQKGKLPRT